MNANENPNAPTKPEAQPGCAATHGSEASILWRIQNYLALGGLFNPEMMDHDKVRELIMDCRTEISRLQQYEQRLKWLHDSGPNDAEGFEWGVFRVKWKNGRAVQVWQTLSDLSDLDAAMREPQNEKVSDPRQ